MSSVRFPLCFCWWLIVCCVQFRLDTCCVRRCRLYLVNSPVVRADNLRFKEEGVRDVVKDVFLPWYNAYRFLMQNVERLQRVGMLQWCIEMDKSYSDEDCCCHTLQLLSRSWVVTKWHRIACIFLFSTSCKILLWRLSDTVRLFLLASRMQDCFPFEFSTCGRQRLPGCFWSCVTQILVDWLTGWVGEWVLGLQIFT